MEVLYLILKNRKISNPFVSLLFEITYRGEIFSHPTETRYLFTVNLIIVLLKR